MRLPELDIVRALAICMIVAVHSYNFLATGPNPISAPYPFSTDMFRNYLADLGLALFFFISGFGLYRNNHVFSTWHDVTGFFRKRALRIFPLYWAALFVYVILFDVLPFKTLAAGYNPSDVSVFPGHSVSTILVYFLGLQGIFSSQASTSRMVAVWFVGVILVYYAVYPLIIAFSPRITYFIAISGLVYLALWALQLVIHTIEPQLFIFYGAFVGGVFASKYALVDKLVRHVNEVRYTARLATGVMAAAVLCVGVGGLLFFLPSIGSNLLPGVLLRTIRYIAFANVLLFLFSLFAVTGVKMLATSPSDSSYRVYRLIAYSSYSVYLFHFPILLMLGFALMYGLTLTRLQINVAIILLGLPCMFVVCYLIQTLQDVAVKRVMSRIAATPSTASP